MRCGREVEWWSAGEEKGESGEGKGVRESGEWRVRGRVWRGVRLRLSSACGDVGQRKRERECVCEWGAEERERVSVCVQV